MLADGGADAVRRRRAGSLHGPAGRAGASAHRQRGGEVVDECIQLDLALVRPGQVVVALGLLDLVLQVPDALARTHVGRCRRGPDQSTTPPHRRTARSRQWTSRPSASIRRTTSSSPFDCRTETTRPAKPISHVSPRRSIQPDGGGLGIVVGGDRSGHAERGQLLQDGPNGERSRRGARSRAPRHRAAAPRRVGAAVSVVIGRASTVAARLGQAGWSRRWASTAVTSTRRRTLASAPRARRSSSNAAAAATAPGRSLDEEAGVGERAQAHGDGDRVVEAPSTGQAGFDLRQRGGRIDAQQEPAPTHARPALGDGGSGGGSPLSELIERVDALVHRAEVGHDHGAGDVELHRHRRHAQVVCHAGALAERGEGARGRRRPPVGPRPPPVAA